jgi:hypothetical protein
MRTGKFARLKAQRAEAISRTELKGLEKDDLPAAGEPVQG